MRRARQAFAAAGAVAGMGAVLLVRSARERRAEAKKKGKPASRKFRLKKKEALPQGIVRIARGRLDSALDQLSGRAGSDPATAVHEARKDIKKLRAVARLVRADPSWNARLRNTARRLAGRRDADVLLETLDALVERGEVTKKGVRKLRKELSAEAGRADDSAEMALAQAELTVARSEVEALAPEKDSFKTLRPGLEKIYRDGRAAHRTARTKPTTENLHEWRKRVKDLWYAATILRPAWPGMMSELAAEAHVLSELLGEDHDLGLLAGRASGKKHKELRRAIAKRRARLKKRALKMGKRLYAEKPKGFSRRIGAAWQASL